MTIEVLTISAIQESSKPGFKQMADDDGHTVLGLMDHKGGGQTGVANRLASSHETGLAPRSLLMPIPQAPWHQE